MKIQRTQWLLFIGGAVVVVVAAGVWFRVANTPDPDTLEGAVAAAGSSVPADLRGQLVNTASQEERKRILDAEWSSWPVFGAATDQRVVSSYVSQLVTQAEGDEPTIEQKEKISTSLSDLIHGISTNDPIKFLHQGIEDGQTLDKSRVEQATKHLVDKVGIARSKLPTDPAKILVMSHQQAGLESKIAQLVIGDGEHGSNIRFREVNAMPTKGFATNMMRIRGRTTVHHSVSKPPRTLQEAILQDGKVLLADVQLFVRQTDAAGGRTQPLYMQLWWDKSASAWRCSDITSFPAQGENTNWFLIF